MTMVDGYAVNAWAGEPMVQQPMAFCWDDRGRLWIAENLDYETRGRGFSKAGNSRILILEDTDRDGVADSRKVFMEGIVFPSAIAVGFDGVYVGAPPNLLFVPDRDGDDKADVADIEVRLTGWGIRDRHEVAEQPALGAGRLALRPAGVCHAFEDSKAGAGGAALQAQASRFPRTSSRAKASRSTAACGATTRPRTASRSSRTASAIPWGIDYDAKGQLVDERVRDPAPLARDPRRHLSPPGRTALQPVRLRRHPDHRRSSAPLGARRRPRLSVGRVSGVAAAAASSWPTSTSTPCSRTCSNGKGSGFTAHHGDDFLMANNAQWVGFSLEIGPDGALYVLDWHDADICGADVLHQHETGRIFRIAPKPFARRSSGRAATRICARCATRSSSRCRRAAATGTRAAPASSCRAARAKGSSTPARTSELREIVPTADSNRRLAPARDVGAARHRRLDTGRARRGARRPRRIRPRLGDPAAHRGRARRRLRARRAFARMARDDRSPVVRLYLASALQRLIPRVAVDDRRRAAVARRRCRAITTCRR